MIATPTKVSWTDPTLNTDGTPIAVGEITNYLVGVRTGVPGDAGTGAYPIQATAVGATASSELISALGATLLPGPYVVAVQTVGPTNSAWSAEAAFVIPQPVLPIPNPPTGLTVT